MAYDDLLPAGTAGVILTVPARSATSGQLMNGIGHGSVSAYFQRDGEADAVPIAVVSGTRGVFVSGGWVECRTSGGTLLGLYQLGVPNSAFAAGVRGVTLRISVNGMIDVVRRYLLTTSDLRISTPSVAPGADGGLPTVDGENRIAGIQGARNTLDALEDLSTTQAQAAAAAALSAYDPPTRVEATSDKNELLNRLGTPAGASVSTDLAGVKADTGSVLARLGAFAGSGANTVLGFLRALARKDVETPSELGGTYAPTTDSLEGAVDTGASGATPAQIWTYGERTLTQPAAQVEAAVRGSTIVLTRGVRNVVTLTGLGSLVGATQIYFTVKRYPDTEADAQAIVQISRTEGLLRLNGAAGTPGEGTIGVVDAAAGNLTLTLERVASAELAPAVKLVYDVKAIFAAGPQLMTKGRCDISADVTRAVS